MPAAIYESEGVQVLPHRSVRLGCRTRPRSNIKPLQALGQAWHDDTNLVSIALIKQCLETGGSLNVHGCLFTLPPAPAEFEAIRRATRRGR